MSLYILPPLLSIITCLVIANIVYHSNKKNLLNRLFALFNLLVVYWIFVDEFMFYQAASQEIGLFWVKIGFLRIFAIPLFVHFILIFTEKTSVLKHKTIYFLLYLPAFFFSACQLATNFLAITRDTVFAENNSLLSILFPAFLIWAFVSITAILVLLIQFHCKTTDKIKKKQTKLIFLGLIITFLTAAASVIMLLLKIEFPKPGSIIIISTNICAAYSIWKYDLFKIDPVKASEYILDTMPDALILVNPEREIIEVNSRFTDVSGYQETEIAGQALEILFMDKEKINRMIDDLLTEKNNINQEVEFKGKSGNIIPVLFSASLIKTKKRQTIGIVCIATDITQLKSAEKQLLLFNEKLQQSNRELQDFAFIASHDLKEPLRKINSFGERLKNKYAGSLDEQGQDYIERMQNAALRMYELIDDLLAYSRVTSKDIPFTPTDLSLVISEVLSDLEVKIEETGGKIEVAGLPVIDADQTQMRQLFQNLVSNALKFHKPGEPAKVKVYAQEETPGNLCTIVVEDNGIGIAEQDYNEIFGIFKRLHSRNEYEGSGIGLSVCKKIMENHHGTIQVESSPGAGSKFIMTFPVSNNRNREVLIKREENGDTCPLP